MGSQDSISDSSPAERPAEVISVNRQATVIQAAQAMKKHRVGCLVVADDSGKLVGIVTERDIVRCIAAGGVDRAAITVEKIMSPDVAWCEGGTSMIAAAGIMARQGIRHLPVVTDGVAVAVISSRDVMAYQSELAHGTRDVTIFALAKLAESRDPDTGEHIERVCGYADVLARELATEGALADRIDDDFIRLLTATCPLHDVGKVGIPDHILLKPGRFSDKEFAIMKTHSRRGAETLDLALKRYPEANFLHMARDIADSHHERFDGDGYPQGLTGNDIPLPARIFAIADVYDALVSKRVYKGAFTDDVASNIITEGKGTQFDPDVVDGFIRCEEKFIKIHQGDNATRAA